MQQFRPSLLERILIMIPWVFIVWLVVKGFEGEIDGLLVVVLLFILIPLSFFINMGTILMLRGRAVIKQLKDAQKGASAKPLKSTNYSDLPWWNPKKWTK